MRVAHVSKAAHPTRREHEVNWGDRTRLEGRQSETLAWVSLRESLPLIVYAHVNVRRGDVVCVVSLEWGHGGASVTSEHAVIQRLRVPLAASMVKISGRLASPDGGTPPPGVAAEVSTFIAIGGDGETLRNTAWFHQTGNAGTIASGAQRVMTIEGFNAGGDTFLHLFDVKAFATGDEPVIMIPARAGRRFRARRFDSQGFRTGVFWATSSNPLTFDADPSASLRVDVELLQ